MSTSAQSEGEKNIVAPRFIVEEREAIGPAQSAAMMQFGPELVRRMKRMVEQGPVGAAPPPMVLRSEARALPPIETQPIAKGTPPGR